MCGLYVYWCHAGLNGMMGQGDCGHHIQFSDSFFFLATPETPLPSPPQGSGQEQYKIAANQASVISHQPLSKQKPL